MTGLSLATTYRVSRLLTLLSLALLGCAMEPISTKHHKALRWERSEGGQHNYLVILPDEALYCEVLWCLVQPVSIGSNATAPYAFAGRLASTQARQEIEHKWSGCPVTAIEVPARCADEIRRLADRADAVATERTECSERLWQEGLLPRLLELDLDSFGDRVGSVR